MKRSSLSRLALLLGLIVLVAGCTGPDAPNIVLEASDCDADDVEIAMNVRKGEVQTNDWLITVEIDVTCQGQPLEGAVVKVQYWWGEVELAGPTDENGHAESEEFSAQNDVSGETITVTVKGADGTEVDQTGTVP